MSFLNQKNLCDIYIHLGEDFSAGSVQTIHGLYEVYGSRQEAAGTQSEEAARLILTNKKKVRFLKFG